MISRRELVVENNLLECHVVRVDVIACADSALGAADLLAITQERLAGVEIEQRHLVSGWNGAAHRQIERPDLQLLTRRQWHSRDGHVVVRMQMNR